MLNDCNINFFLLNLMKVFLKASVLTALALPMQSAYAEEVQITLKGKSTFYLRNQSGEIVGTAGKNESFTLEVDQAWAKRFHKVVRRSDKLRLIKEYYNSLAQEDKFRKGKVTYIKVNSKGQESFFALENYIKRKNHSFRSVYLKTGSMKTKSKNSGCKNCHVKKKEKQSSKLRSKGKRKSKVAVKGKYLNCKIKRRTALECLLCNCVNESSTESAEGIKTGANVPKVRARDKNTNICTEVYREEQFSWWNLGVRKRAWSVPPIHKCRRFIDSETVKEEVDLAQAYNHYFNPNRASPLWKNKCYDARYGKKIGRHYFCRIYANNKTKSYEKIKSRSVSSIKLMINAQVHKAIRLWDASYKLVPINFFSKTVIDLFNESDLKEKPSVAVGDFNGDGATDYALMLYSKNLKLVKFVLAIKNISSGEYSVSEIHQHELVSEPQGRIASYLNLLGMKKVKWLPGDLKKDLIQVEVFSEDEASVKAFMFQDGKVVESNKTLIVLKR